MHNFFPKKFCKAALCRRHYELGYATFKLSFNLSCI